MKKENEKDNYEDFECIVIDVLRPNKFQSAKSRAAAQDKIKYYDALATAHH